MARITASIAFVFIFAGSPAFSLNGTIIDHRVIETTEVDGARVPGKIEITEEECQALALSRGLKIGEVITADQPLSEAEMAVQESLTGRQVISRKVSFCLAR